jgi:hypothetical protein
MKNTIRIPVVLLSILFLFSIILCTSLKETVFKGNPDFEKNAEKYLVTSPLTQFSSKPYTFIFEETKTYAVYEIMVQWSEESNIEGDFDEENLEEGKIGKEREYLGQRVIISNSVDDRNYEVIGNTTIFRSLFKYSEKLTEETTVISYPLEFRIFEQGIDVGTIIMPEPSAKMSAFIHDRQINLEFGELTKSYSFEYQNDLIAFFELKPEKSFNYKNFIGTALLKPGLSNDFIADIFTTYIVAEIIIKSLADKKFKTI